MNARHGVLACTFASVLLLSSPHARGQEAAGTEPPSQPATEAGEAPAGAKTAITMRYDAGLLTADIDNRPLPEVIAALAEQLPLKVYLRVSIREKIDQQNVNRKFERRPVQDAFRDIFRNQNYLLNYPRKSAAGDDASAEPSIEIWLLGGSGAYSELLAEARDATEIEPPSILSTLEAAAETGEDYLQEASEEDLRLLARNASDVRTRYNAMLHLGDRVESPEDVAVFVGALEDEVPEVRWMALTQILMAREDVPPDVYRNIYVSDPDPNMKKQALAVFAFKDREAAKPFLEEVRVGGNAEMSAHAEQLLDKLNKQTDAAPAQ